MFAPATLSLSPRGFQTLFLSLSPSIFGSEVFLDFFSSGELQLRTLSFAAALPNALSYCSRSFDRSCSWTMLPVAPAFTMGQISGRVLGHPIIWPPHLPLQLLSVHRVSVKQKEKNSKLLRVNGHCLSLGFCPWACYSKVRNKEKSSTDSSFWGYLLCSPRPPHPSGRGEPGFLAGRLPHCLLG